MNGLRFKVGDLVRVVVALPVDHPVVNGSVGTILEVGEFEDTRGLLFPYDIDFPEDHGSEFTTVCHDWQLAPVNPPVEPASLTRREDCEVEA